VRITVNDGEDTSATREVNINVARANDAPVMDLDAGALGTSAALAYNIGDPLTRIAPAGTVVDIDSANLSGGSLRVAFSDNGAPDDQLAIVTDAAVTLTGFAGSTVRINGTAIGTVFGGSNGTDLVVIFNSNATPARVQALLEHIGYSNPSASPSTLPREVTFTLNDGDGTANGGQNTGSATATITFPSANDPPVLTGDLTGEVDEGGSYAITADDLGFTDPDDVAADVTFTVTNPVNGEVRVGGVAVTSFSGTQLVAGLVSFSHNGSETAAASFDVAVEDGDEDGSVPVAQTFSLTVTATNDPHTGILAIGGTAAEDATLTADTSGLADVDGLGTFSYLWHRDGTPIIGATGATFTLGDADVGHTLTVNVSYTDGQGFAESATSAATAEVIAFDDGDATVTISGMAQEDSVLTANFAADDPDGAAMGVSYQWHRDGVEIIGATASTYTPSDADIGAALTVTVSYSDGQGFAETITSAPTAEVIAFDEGDATVTISGTAQEDSVLTANFADDDPDGTATGMSYQWHRDGVAIDGAMGSTYTLGDADVGAAITVSVSYTDGQGFAETIASAPTAEVIAFDEGDATVTISGTAQEDSVLTVNFADDDPDGAATGVRYQWHRDGVGIDGATASTYTLGDADVGAAITVSASYTDGQGFAETITSAATVAVVNVNDVPTANDDIGLAAPPGTGWVLNPDNGHYYKFVAVELDWTDALLAAPTIDGAGGYLVTVTSANENAFIQNLMAANGSLPVWLGASDHVTDGMWRWADGPEAGTLFWSGGPDGVAIGFQDWNFGEPNGAGHR
jgi:hypothetical protein